MKPNQFAAALIVLAATFTQATTKPIVANDYGAKPDGTLSTIAIQKALDAAALKGGTVTLRPGTYLTGSLFLKSGTPSTSPKASPSSAPSTSPITLSSPPASPASR